MWGDKTSFSLSYSNASRSMVNDAVSSFSTSPNLSLQVAVLVVRLWQAQATDLFLLVGCRVMVGLAQSFGTPACLSWLGRTSPTFNCLCGVSRFSGPSAHLPWGYWWTTSPVCGSDFSAVSGCVRVLASESALLEAMVHNETWPLHCWLWWVSSPERQRPIPERASPSPWLYQKLELHTPFPQVHNWAWAVLLSVAWLTLVVLFCSLAAVDCWCW